MFGEHIFDFMVRKKLVSTGMEPLIFFWPRSKLKNLKQSFYDSYPLSSHKSYMAILLCTDKMLVAISKSKQPFGEQISSWFNCRHRDHLSTDFQGIVMERNDQNTYITQQSYIDHLPPSAFTYAKSQSDPSRPMKNNELSSHITVAGRLVLIATASNPSAFISGSVYLQGNTKPICLLALSASAVKKT